MCLSLQKSLQSEEEKNTTYKTNFLSLIVALTFCMSMFHCLDFRQQAAFRRKSLFLQQNNIMSCLASKFSMGSLSSAGRKNTTKKMTTMTTKNRHNTKQMRICFSLQSLNRTMPCRWCVYKLIEFIFQCRNLIHTKYKKIKEIDADIRRRFKPCSVFSLLTPILSLSLSLQLKSIMWQDEYFCQKK